MTASIPKTVRGLKQGELILVEGETYAVAQSIPMFKPGQWALTAVLQTTGEHFTTFTQGSQRVEVVGKLPKAETLKMLFALQAAEVIG